MSKFIKAKFKWKEKDLLKAKNLEKGGKVQKAIDAAVIKYSMPYCPWKTGTLAQSPCAHTVIGSGKVVYEGPYARYLYYGEVYGPNIPIFENGCKTPVGFWSPPKKYPTGRKLQFRKDINPLAGPFWFERMKAARKDDILREAKKACRN